MLTRGCFVSLFILFVVIFANARPPKRMHYDDATLTEDAEFDPEGSRRPQPPAVQPDPLATARQLACEPVVIHSFLMAWKSTLNGTRNHGLGESGFAIQSYMSTLSIQGWREAAINDLLIPADEDTVAIAHVHGRNADERPATMDLQSRVPNFVISLDALYVTIPGTARFIRLRGGVNDADGWNKGCGSATLFAAG